MTGGVEHFQPSKRDLAPSCRSPDYTARKSERKAFDRAGTNRNDGRCDGASLSIRCSVKERRLRQSSDQPPKLDFPKVCLQWARASYQQMGKTRRIVAHYEGVVDARTPPFVFRAQPDGHAS